MAKISKYLESDFIAPLVNEGYLPSSIHLHLSYGGLGGALFNRTLIANISDSNEFEIPVTMRRMVEFRLAHNADMIVCNLMPRRLEIRTARTAESAIRQLNLSNINYGLRGLKSHKGGSYWGAPGLMFDENFSLLYIYILKGFIDLHKGKYIYNKGVLYVSPQVMLREDEMMYKAIKKKLIPLVLENKNRLRPVSSGRGMASDNFTTEVVIGDLSRFAHRVREPEGEDINGSLNALLNENIDNVLGNLNI